MELLGLSLCVLEHPIDTFRVVQRIRDRFRFYPILLLLALVVVVRLLFIQCVSFPLQMTDPRYANWVLESLMFLVPMISLAVCSFATTSILGGEMKMQEALTAVAYSLIPFILFSLPLAALSHLLSRGSALFSIIEICIWVWCALLFILSIKVMNSYTLGETLLVLFLTILLIALLWAVLLLVYALWNQLVSFIESVRQEIKFVLRS